MKERNELNPVSRDHLSEKKYGGSKSLHSSVYYREKKDGSIHMRKTEVNRFEKGHIILILSLETFSFGAEAQQEKTNTQGRKSLWPLVYFLFQHTDCTR